MNVQIEPSWKEVLKDEFDAPYFTELVRLLKAEKQAGRTIYPSGTNIFNAFNHTPFDKVKVVIIGQDPYHGPGQAHGLSFSVPKGIKPPPSLVNIFKELQSDLGLQVNMSNGDLTPWADQGVLLLNAALTVRAGEPMSHANAGWSEFTNAVIRKISTLKSHVVFVLWGKFAQEKVNLIDTSKHFILKSTHPSPLSANYGFLGSRPFSKTNEQLVKAGVQPIDWSLA
ncbi:uracil-DNA glycosylase [Pollutibacter soli]|uniref:uracil-DNA glycosylase n=1 Tax=Pollutibacter soli TaxID=3034157 RepID=UPI0030137ED1